MRAPRLSHVLPACLIAASLTPGCAGGADGVSATGLPRASNEPPVGVLEAPRDGAAAAGSLTISGWAADDSGIRAIRIVVDGELAAIVGLSLQRPDVSAAYPHLRHGTDNHGWETRLDRLEPWPHSIRVLAVDSDGAITDLGVRRVAISH